MNTLWHCMGTQKAEEEAAKVYEEFVESFGVDEGGKDGPGVKTFVRGGTVTPGQAPEGWFLVVHGSMHSQQPAWRDSPRSFSLGPAGRHGPAANPTGNKGMQRQQQRLFWPQLAAPTLLSAWRAPLFNSFWGRGVKT